MIDTAFRPNESLTGRPWSSCSRPRPRRHAAAARGWGTCAAKRAHGRRRCCRIWRRWRMRWRATGARVRAGCWLINACVWPCATHASEGQTVAASAPQGRGRYCRQRAACRRLAGAGSNRRRGRRGKLFRCSGVGMRTLCPSAQAQHGCHPCAVRTSNARAESNAQVEALRLSAAASAQDEAVAIGGMRGRLGELETAVRGLAGQLQAEQAARRQEAAASEARERALWQQVRVVRWTAAVRSRHEAPSGPSCVASTTRCVPVTWEQCAFVFYLAARGMHSPGGPRRGAAAATMRRHAAKQGRRGCCCARHSRRTGGAARRRKPAGGGGGDGRAGCGQPEAGEGAAADRFVEATTALLFLHSMAQHSSSPQQATTGAII